MEQTTSTPEAEYEDDIPRLPTSFRDVNGNSGVGLVGVIGMCAECGHTNRVVGPRDANPFERTCFGGCDSQRGPTAHERKMQRMGW